MPSYYDLNQGFFVHQPSWHRLEHAVLSDWPGNWTDARKIAKLEWEPESEPVYAEMIRANGSILELPSYQEIKGWKQIKRSDTGDVLSIQTDAYRIIDNTALGYVVDTLLGSDWGAEHKYEGVFTLHGGRLVVVVIRDEQETTLPGDNSPTLTYTVIVSRHDGQGGLQVMRTKIRVVCANTLNMAQHMGIEGKTSFVIKHSANWDDKVAEVREKLALASADEKYYEEVSEQLLLAKATVRNRETFLKRFMPIGDDMGERQVENRQREREQVRSILSSRTSEGIADTYYGLWQAGAEWAEHFKRSRSSDTYVTRSLVTKDPLRIRAFTIAKQMAKV